MSRGLSANQRLVIEQHGMINEDNLITVAEMAEVNGKTRYFPRGAEFGFASHGTYDYDRRSIFRMMASLKRRGLVRWCKPYWRKRRGLYLRPPIITIRRGRR